MVSDLYSEQKDGFIIQSVHVKMKAQREKLASSGNGI